MSIVKRILRKAVKWAALSRLLSAGRISGWLYRIEFGRRLDLTHPLTLNEKILWLSFRTDTSLWSELADKYRVREYVISRGLGELLVPLYGVYDSADDIRFEELPDSFVVKSNNGYGTVIIVRDKCAVDVAAMRRELARWLRTSFGRVTAEPHYLRIKPRIVIEKLLSDRPLTDYKMWCIGGKVRVCLTCSDRNPHTHEAKLGVYEVPSWRRRPDLLTAPFRNDIEVSCPRRLSDMIRYAEILSEGFPVVRVDFYEVDGCVYFGEMTFTSAAGRMTYFTDEFQREMGDLVRLDGLSAENM